MQMPVKGSFKCTEIAKRTFFKFLSFFSLSGGRVALATADVGGGVGRVGLTA